MKYVAIDLVHQNGNMVGNAMTLEMFSQLLNEMHTWKGYYFFLITNKENSEYYAKFNNVNMKAVRFSRTVPKSSDEVAPYTYLSKAITPSKSCLYTSVAAQKVKNKVLYKFAHLKSKLQIQPNVVHKLNKKLNIQIGLTFCPSGIPKIVDQTLPQLIIPINLVGLEYPYAFSPSVLHKTKHIFQHIVANHMHCLMFSEYTMSIFSNYYDYCLDMLSYIPGFVAHDSHQKISTPEIINLLSESEKKELVYSPLPARPEFEHNSLLVAFSMYLRSTQNKKAHLVLSELTQKQHFALSQIAKKIGISKNISLFETLNISERRAIIEKSKMIIFNGFFEEANPFLLEALSSSNVYCANNQFYFALPKGIVNYFDYRDPSIVCDAICKGLSVGTSKLRDYQQQANNYLLDCSLQNYSLQLRNLFDQLYHNPKNH